MAVGTNFSNEIRKSTDVTHIDVLRGVAKSRGADTILSLIETMIEAVK